MVASVQELILAANAKRDESPLISIAKALASGYDSYRTSKTSSLEDLARQVSIQSAQQKIKYQQDFEREYQAQQAEKDRARSLKNDFNSLGGASRPAIPAIRLQQEIVRGADGFKVVEPKQTSLEDRLGSLVDSGQMTIEQAYQLKNRSGGGLPASLVYTMGKDQEKKAAEEKAKAIPGYTRTGEVNPDDTEVRNLRTAAPELETFKSAVTDYKELISKYGTQEMGNREVQGQMNALAKNLQLKVKNLAQLGVLSASDVPFIEEQIPGPGLFKTKEGMLGALKTAESLMETAVQNRLKTAGYKKDAPADLSIGTVEDGYRYKGGDKADPNNWEKVQ